MPEDMSSVSCVAHHFHALKQAMITLQEMAVLIAYMVNKWLS